MMFSAKAATMSAYWDALLMSGDFVNNLAKCAVYQEEKKAEILGSETTSVYNIYGRKNEGCAVEIRSESIDGTQIVQHCVFDEKITQKFVAAMQDLQKEKAEKTFSQEDLLQNENYAAVWRILFDENICMIKREKSDLTALVREHLKSCVPYKQTQNIGILQVTREIKGKAGDFCVYRQITQQNQLPLNLELARKSDTLQNLLQYIQTQQFVTECKFSAEQKAEYIRILTTMVIPPAVGMENILQPFDRSSSLREESAFLEQNCELLVPDTDRQSWPDAENPLK